MKKEKLEIERKWLVNPCEEFYNFIENTRDITIASICQHYCGSTGERIRNTYNYNTRELKYESIIKKNLSTSDKIINSENKIKNLSATAYNKKIRTARYSIAKYRLDITFLDTSKYKGELIIDIFLSDKLIIIEKEFDNISDAENYTLPKVLKLFISKEVTSDSAYSNYNLAKKGAEWHNFFGKVVKNFNKISRRTD